MIDVHALTLEEKQQILYNHLRVGKQPNEFRRKIKPFLEEISALPQFIPEVARRLSDPAFTKNILLRSYYLKRFVEELQDQLPGITDTNTNVIGSFFKPVFDIISPQTFQGYRS